MYDKACFLGSYESESELPVVMCFLTVVKVNCVMRCVFSAVMKVKVNYLMRCVLLTATIVGVCILEVAPFGNL